MALSATLWAASLALSATFWGEYGSFFVVGDTFVGYCTGNLNGDAAADIVGYAGDGLKFKLGNSSLEQRLNSVQGPKQICAANFIADPLPEAVVCGELFMEPMEAVPSPLQMAMHENLGGGLMREDPRPLWLSAPPMLNAKPVDLNGDGAMDLVALWEHPWGGSLRYAAFINDGLGQLDSASAIGSLFSQPVYSGLLPYLRDLDLDGDTDLMHYDGFQMGVCLNNGNGTFAPESDYPLNGTASSDSCSSKAYCSLRSLFSS